MTTDLTIVYSTRTLRLGMTERVYVTEYPDTRYRVDYVEVEVDDSDSDNAIATFYGRRTRKRDGMVAANSATVPVWSEELRPLRDKAIAIAKGDTPPALTPTPTPTLVGTKTTATIHRRTLGTFVEQAVNLLARNSSEFFEVDMDAHTTRTGMTRAEISVGGGMGALLALSNVNSKMEG